MRKQPSTQIKTYRGSNSYAAPLARFEFQIDIMDMKPLTKEPEVEVPIKNDEPRYAMAVFDIFSKLANVAPMKEKTGPNALSAPTGSLKKWVFRCPLTVIMTVPSKRGHFFLRKKASLTSSPYHKLML